LEILQIVSRNMLVPVQISDDDDDDDDDSKVLDVILSH